MTDREDARKVYADVIDLPHHQSTKRKHMSLYDRAAQFASYKALSGYEDMIVEEARLTDSAIELSENETDMLNAVIGELADRLACGDHPAVSVTFFQPDAHKAGGRYETLTGILKKIDTASKRLVLYGSEDIENRRIPAIEIEINRIISLNIIADSLIDFALY